MSGHGREHKTFIEERGGLSAPLICWLENFLWKRLVQNYLLCFKCLVAAGVIGVSNGLDLNGIDPLHLAECEHQAVICQCEGDVRQSAVLLGKI